MPRSQIESEQALDADFALQTELERVSHNNDVGLIFDPATMNNVALYDAVQQAAAVAVPLSILLTRQGNVSNSFLAAGQVITSVTGVNMALPGYITSISARDGGTQEYRVRLGFNSLQTNTYPIDLSVINGFATQTFAENEIPFNQNDQMRAYIQKVANNSADNPIVIVSARFL